MTRNFYGFSIFFAALAIFVGLFQSIIYLRLGTQAYTMDSFRVWFAVTSAIALVGSILLLWYYKYKNFTFAFWTALIFTIIAIGQFVVIYSLLNGNQSLAPYYLPAYFLVLVAGIINAISLIFSDAGTRVWLRVAGIISAIIGIILIVAISWSVTANDAAVNSTVETIHQWLALVRSILPLLFILNFLEEWKHATRDDSSLRSTWLDGGLLSISALALVSSLILAIQYSSESYWVIKWNNEAPARAARLATPFEARTYVDSKGETLLYRLYVPEDYNPETRYPLVVCLHHGGAHGDDNLMQVDGSPPAQLLYQQRTKYPAILFLPQCPKGASWGQSANMPSIQSLIFEAMKSLENEFSIDEKRRYVVGISGGGYGSWHFIGTNPEMFAAAIPICGGGDVQLAPNMTDVAVWAFHGEKDHLVPVAYSREMIDAIKKAGGTPQYTEIPGAGHNIWENVKATPGLITWMFEQKRE